VTPRKNNVRAAAAVIVSAGLALAAACGRGGQAAATKAPATGPAASTDQTPASLDRRLALQRPDGNTAVDALLTSDERAVGLEPTKADLWVLLGQAWVRKARESADPGFYVNARAAADVALAIDPEHSGALDLQGLSLLNDHRFESARSLAQQIVDRRPDDAAALGTLSDALLELGRVDEAADSAQRMIDLKPNLPSYVRASYLRWITGDVDGAVRAARLAIDSGSDGRYPEPRAWAVVQAAAIFAHEGDYAGAEAGYDRALRQVPDYPPALVGKGRVALARGDARAAAALLDRAYDSSPLAETAWLLGDARAMGGDDVGARRAYDRLEHTGRASDHRTLALFWATKNVHAQEALALAEAERDVRGDLYTDDAYAWALYRNGRLADAGKAIDRALSHHTRDARLLYHAGAIRCATGDTAGGRALVRQALALDPAFDVTGAGEARRLMADGSIP